MRNKSNLVKRRKIRLFWYNYYWHLWFRYHNTFFGSLMYRGNKIRAFNNFLKIHNGLKSRELYDPYLVFLVSMMKVTPAIVLLPMRRGSVSQGVPMPITENKRICFGVKWVLKLLKDRAVGLSFPLVIETLILALYNKGSAIEKKEDVYIKGRQNRHLIKFFK